MKKLFWRFFFSMFQKYFFMCVIVTFHFMLKFRRKQNFFYFCLKHRNSRFFTHSVYFWLFRFSHACILKGTDIIVTGGYSDGYLNTTEALDTLSWTWSPLPDLQLSRSYHTMELVNDKIMVFGGSDAQNSSETFDGTAWTVETLAHKHIYHASVTVPCA